MSGACAPIGPVLKGVAYAPSASEACNGLPACEFFIYHAHDRTAQLCRGFGTAAPAPSSGSVIGIKPSSVRIAGMAVLTNLRALCLPARAMAEFSDLASIDVAAGLCNAMPECSHFSFPLAGPRSMLVGRPRVLLCRGGVVAVPQEGSIVPYGPWADGCAVASWGGPIWPR
eukprot:CAMPEP_0204516062 /NCGR_PEP_ID=MMETSP0661-20131031/2948_1 /ASSEMBLY_ACC=CAM_ASM_000606 /TAXON_ID=109239 /ORGANISM="Alexandrium margalefi, Strain AMGDE01CS-322" /LENGTH=170 /DNA_ID=CAMNT_0051521405 /DNA_START=211 /DNA_END=724 /DNA_ORIENTATION=-